MRVTARTSGPPGPRSRRRTGRRRGVVVPGAQPLREAAARGLVGLPTARRRVGDRTQEHPLGLRGGVVEEGVARRHEGARPRPVGQHAHRAGDERLDVLQAVRLVGRGGQERRRAGQGRPVVLARRRQGAHPGPVVQREPHGALGRQVRLVQPGLDPHGCLTGHALDDVQEELRLLAVGQVDRRVEHDGHLGIAPGQRVVEPDAQVHPRHLGLLGEGRDGPALDHLPDLARGALGVGERREQGAGQCHGGALDRVGELRRAPPDEVHDPRVGATRRGERPPDPDRVGDSHVDHDRVVRVDELQRQQVEPVAAPRTGADEHRAGEDAQQPADQRGAGVVPRDVAVGVDEHLRVPDRDPHRSAAVTSTSAGASSVVGGVPSVPADATGIPSSDRVGWIRMP